MIITQARLTNYKEKATQYNITFSVPKNIDELQLIQSLKTSGYLAFSPDEFKKQVEEFMNNKKIGVIEKGKSKSTVLRGRIFSKWLEVKEKGKTKKSSEVFYNDCMDYLIEYLTTK